MASLSELIQLCRLCLVKDHVNIPIFDDPENVRQIPLKISSCLPVKISIDDNLPKKICDGCSNKLDLCYEFWNSTAHAEKTLLAMVEEKENQVPEAEMPQPFLLKVEAVESLEESQNQICEPPVPKPILVKDEEEAEDPPAKRPRRSAAIQAQMQIIPESDDEDDAAEGLATTKEVAEMDDDFEDPDVPDMIVDIDEVKPGPSGLNQTGVNSQFNEVNMFYDDYSIDIKEEPMEIKIKKESDSSDDDPEQHTVPRPQNLESGVISMDIKGEDTVIGSNQPSKSSNKMLKKTADENETDRFSVDFYVKKGFQCDQCGKCFSKKRNLNIHLKIHSGAKPYLCQECGKSFLSGLSLTVHLRTHTNEKPFKCNECDKCFSDKCTMQRHVRSHTAEKSYKCQICEKCFTRRTHLHRHVLTHSRKNTINCKICDKPFLDKFSLQRHLRTHSGEKPYKCDECDKCFSQKFHLHRHALVHSSKKSFKCKECDKSFSDLVSMQKHLPVHNSEISFQCEECDKYFLTKTRLTAHLRIHSSEKPFNCAKCGKGFSQKGNLCRHLYTVHDGEKTFKCEQCEKRFSQKISLDYHLQTTHTS